MNERIIKPGAAFAAAKVVKSDVYDATLAAAQIVDAAHVQARRILENAEQDRQTVIEAALREGYEHGLAQWNAAVAKVNAARDRYISESEPELVRLAVRIAQKILGEELRTNPEAIVNITRECLRGLSRERSLAIRVHPSDLDLMRRSIDLLHEAAGPQRSINVVADPAVGAGGCIVESEYGVVDARLETQIRCMEELLVRAARK